LRLRLDQTEDSPRQFSLLSPLRDMVLQCFAVHRHHTAESLRWSITLAIELRDALMALRAMAIRAPRRTQTNEPEDQGFTTLATTRVGARRRVV